MFSKLSLYFWLKEINQHANRIEILIYSKKDVWTKVTVLDGFTVKELIPLFIIITGRNEVVAKVIFLHLSFIHSVHRGEGGCLSACWDPLGADTPLQGADTPPPEDQTPPRTRHPPGPPPGADTHPPSEQTPPPPRSRHPTRSKHPPGADTPPEQTPPSPPGADYPPRADTSIRSTRGRYAFYWNAFLLIIVLQHKSIPKTVLFVQLRHQSGQLDVSNLEIDSTKEFTGK